MACSEAQRRVLAKARAVKAERRAALRAANAQKVDMVRKLGVTHLGEVVYLPPSDLSTALITHLGDGGEI